MSVFEAVVATVEPLIVKSSTTKEVKPARSVFVTPNCNKVEPKVNSPLVDNLAFVTASSAIWFVSTPEFVMLIVISLFVTAVSKPVPPVNVKV